MWIVEMEQILLTQARHATEDSAVINEATLKQIVRYFKWTVAERRVSESRFNTLNPKRYSLSHTKNLSRPI